MQALGVLQSKDRLEIYKRIEDKLSKNTKEYFNNNLDIIKFRNN